MLHSPPRKVTAQEQAEWKIPPCISNWKNPKGYTIPLDKRLAADGRGLQETVISDKFAKLSQTLYIADRQAREEVAARNELQKRIAQAEKEKKEEKLRELAAQAREERSGLALGRSRNDNPEEMQAEREREKIRHDREKEIQRDMRMNTMGKETKSKILARYIFFFLSPSFFVGNSRCIAARKIEIFQRKSRSASHNQPCPRR